MVPRLTLGLALGAVAALAWLLALLALGPSPLGIVGVGLIIAGFALAAWAHTDDRIGLAGTGLVAAALGIAVFYEGALTGSTGQLAGLAFLIGTFVAGIATWRDAWTATRIGYAIAALGGVIWVISDLDAWAWQPGNLLMAAACILALTAVGGD